MMNKIEANWKPRPFNRVVGKIDRRIQEYMIRADLPFAAAYLRIVLGV